MMLENMRYGYYSRRQAFEAAQRMEAEHLESTFALMDEYGWLGVPPDERILFADDFMNALEGRNPTPKAPSGRSTKKHKRKQKPHSRKDRRRK